MAGHKAALWLRLEPAEGVATVPRCVYLANTFAGVSLVDRWRRVWQEREPIAPERCRRAHCMAALRAWARVLAGCDRLRGTVSQAEAGH